MGFVRFLLALSVVSFHSDNLTNFRFFHQSLAVVSFFIISGFYMSLVLDTKYRPLKKRYKTFITNRFLRIYPLYFVVLFLTVGSSIIKYFFHIGTPDNAITHYLFFLPQTTHEGLETINFIFRNLTLLLTTDYFSVGSRGPGFLIIQQAWSLQIELLFYLIVPFLFYMKKKFLVILSILYLLLFFGYFHLYHHMEQPTLTYRFFEYFVFFLLGIGSYYLYKKMHKLSIPPIYHKIISGITIVYIVLYTILPHSSPAHIYDMTTFPYYLFLTLAIPSIFIISKKSAIDAFIGGISYPLFVSHIFFIKLFQNISFISPSVSFLAAILVAIIGSILLMLFIENPLDTFRDKLFQKEKSSLKKRS
ncbi:MAG: acyltransferase [Candidatus Levybacteria bacterium]|nr:acyltransferase [Candidatus Levybacteria bacterium]